MEQLNQMQHNFLTQAKAKAVPMTMFLMNGFQLRGIITQFDERTVVLETDGKQQLIYKHAISTVVPHQPVELG
ncbi:RNA chaperone Hfq [Bengtsoniella intestinalis]|uniref:RNA chaperone Hfq n=1 Tax=Bengtsoniella intestinalis TaxID=3073143 RepID=UPI00391F14D8